tara:strand:+ start:491 stop:1486 length:996 start_codon:yes stop_codon:yes gene_type:complete
MKRYVLTFLGLKTRKNNPNRIVSRDLKTLGKISNILKEDNPITIVDIGAAGGLQRRWQNLEPHIRSILFEPEPKSFIELNDNSIANFKVLNTVLSNKKGHINFNICTKSEVSSVYKPNLSFLKLFHHSERFTIEKSLDLETNTLENELENNEINEIDFIKVDAQGHELNILEGAGSFLSGTIGIETEVEFAPLYIGQPMFDDVNQYLKNKSFDLVDLKRYYWKRKTFDHFLQDKGQLIFGDALFLKSPESIYSSFGANQKKIIRAIVIYLTYGYVDLAHALYILSKDLFDSYFDKKILEILRKFQIQQPYDKIQSRIKDWAKSDSNLGANI